MIKTALILGATSDISVAIAHRLGRAGVSLQLAGRRAEPLQDLAKDLRVRYGVGVDVLTFDAEDFDAHAAFYAGLPTRPDITFCVFGVMEDETAARTDWQSAQRMINVNYTGAVSILNTVVNDYLTVGEGIIVGISSVAGERGRQSKLVYGSSKAAFSAYLSGLRQLTDGTPVHVLTVKPGFVYTRMTADLDLNPLLTVTPDKLADATWRAVQKRKNVLYVKGIWQFIMTGIKAIPEPIFKKMRF